MALSVTFLKLHSTLFIFQGGFYYPFFCFFTLWFIAGPVVILVLAIRHGVGGWSHLDRACLAIAGLGIAGWLILDEPRIGVLLHTLADIAGTAPTVRKAWREPASEPLTPWLWFLTASSLNLFLIEHLSIGEALYPIWLCLSCVLVVGALVMRSKAFYRR